jgi:Transposase IS66 family
VQYGSPVLVRALYLHNYQLLPCARTAEAMRELFGCALSAGTLAHAVRQWVSWEGHTRAGEVRPEPLRDRCIMEALTKLFLVL